MEKIELSVLLPCLNEEKTIEKCILKIKECFLSHNINGEIIIIDNNCTDNSIVIANKYEVIVVKEETIGYGSALIKGNKEARGKYILMADCDDTYELDKIDKFLSKIKEGYDLVIGNRFTQRMDNGAMSLLNRYIGNPFLSFVGRFLFKINVKDFHCGIRIYTKEMIDKLNLTSKGMEYASEMIIKASINKYKIAEIPTILKNANVKRKSHLKPFKDGIRHLRLMFNIYIKRNQL